MTVPIQTYTIQEVRKLLKVSRGTVHEWFKRGLKSIKIGGTRRIRATALERFLDQHSD